MVGVFRGWYGVIDGLPVRVDIQAMRKLTEKQEKFAQNVGAAGLSQAEAYRRAYEPKKMSDEAIWTQASIIAKKPMVAQRIMELKETRVATAVDAITFDVRKLLETYLAIAFVDPNELIAQKVGACRHCWGVGGRYHWKEREYLTALSAWERKPVGDMPDPSGGLDYRFSAAPNPECLECEGDGVHRVVPMDTTKLSPGAKLLYRGVQQTKDGVKVLFRDQDKALEQIGRILGAFDDKLRVDLTGKVAQLKLMTSDPKEAADAYAKMVSGGA